jgi:hypothetical protein
MASEIEFDADVDIDVDVADTKVGGQQAVCLVVGMEYDDLALSCCTVGGRDKYLLTVFVVVQCRSLV